MQMETDLEVEAKSQQPSKRVSQSQKTLSQVKVVSQYRSSNLIITQSSTSLRNSRFRTRKINPLLKSHHLHCPSLKRQDHHQCNNLFHLHHLSTLLQHGQQLLYPAADQPIPALIPYQPFPVYHHNYGHSSTRLSHLRYHHFLCLLQHRLCHVGYGLRVTGSMPRCSTSRSMPRMLRTKLGLECSSKL